MNKYRIVKTYTGKFKVQKKFLWFWIEALDQFFDGENRFLSVEYAETALRHRINREKVKDEVMKEIEF